MFSDDKTSYPFQSFLLSISKYFVAKIAQNYGVTNVQFKQFHLKM